MIGSIDPLGIRLAVDKTGRTGGRPDRAAETVPRTEAATVVQLSDYALGRRERRDRESSRPPSWAQAVVQMVHEAAIATRAAILGSPAQAESAQAQLSPARVLDLMT